MKKVISMMMALAMTFALAIPAFAAATASSYSFDASSVSAGGQYNINSAGHTFTMGTFTQTPTINVYVPAATANDKLVLNPYGLKYTLGAQVDAQEQVISSPIFLGSLSNVPVQVGMTVKATHPQNVILASKSLAEDTRTKTNSVFIWGQVADAGEAAAISELASVSFSDEYDDEEGKTGSMILVKSGEAGSTRTGLYTIPAASDHTDVAKTKWACVKFFGDAVKAPTTPWASADTVTLNITFTFTPSMESSS